jgi:SAM-dependent methyltransferase
MPSSNSMVDGPLLQHVRCNLCGADNTTLLHGDGVLHLVRCRGCGLVYVTPRLAEDAIQYLYANDYFGSRSRAGLGYLDYAADQECFLRTFRKRMRWLETYGERGGRLLDVGCAAGFFMQVGRERGWEVYGVEPASCMAEFARSELGLEVFEGKLREADFQPGFFDAVTLWDVLEHLTDPHQELLEINRVLRPGGLLVLETQNIASWVARALGKRWHHYGNELHLFHFSPQTITCLLADTGFRVHRITAATAGKVCSLRFVVDKLNRFSETASRAAAALFRYWPGLSRRSLYLNPGDEMIVCAQKSVEMA